MKNNKEITFGNVLDNSLKIASLLKNAGVEKGMKVAIMSENCSEFIFIYLALLRLEAIMIPINVKFKSLALRQILSDSEAKCLIYSNVYEEDIITATEILDNINIYVSFEENSSLTNNNLSDFNKYAIYGGPYNNENDLASIIFYSEGTTGPANGVIYSQQALISNAYAFQSALLIKENYKIYAQFPFSHFFSMTSIVNNSLINEIPIIISNDLSDVNNVSNGKDIILIAKPSFYENIVNTDSFENFNNFQFCMSGGGKVKKEVTEYFLKKYNLPIYKSYGMIEAGPIILINTNEKKIHSIGIPLHDISVSIMRDEEFLKSNEIGEICIRNTNVVKEYCSQKKKISDCIFVGWYKSGDLGFQDMDGYYYFVDRKINIINKNGFEVYPELIENELYKHENIKQIAVVGVKANKTTQKIIAYIVTKDKKIINRNELVLFLEKNIPKYQIPDEFVFLDHLPKNATGKIARQSLRRKNTKQTGGKQ